MPTADYKPEQIVARLRQIGMFTAQGQPLAAACKEAAIPEQSDCHWKKEYGGLKLGQAKKRKDLERKNARLKKIGADLSLESVAKPIMDASFRPW